jgi:hypothetical protein
MKTKSNLKLGLGISVVDVQFAEDGWLISARGRGSRCCPGCGKTSNSYHGRYSRRLRDLPVQGSLVLLEIPSRRWRCRNPGCRRQTFVEQLPQIVEPFGRQICRVTEIVRLLGHATGGKPAAERLLARLGVPVSDDTVLRHLTLIASLIRAEHMHRQARSISYRITGAKFPVLKDLDKFAFAGTVVDEGWCANWRPAPSWMPGATRFLSGAPAPARRIYVSPSLRPSSVPKPVAGSIILSTWSISSSRRKRPAAVAG